MSRSIQARGKRRAQVDEGICSTCGDPLPHTIPLVHGRSKEEADEAFERVLYSFGPAPARAKAARLSPLRVTQLRSLGCALLNYPAVGTPEWDAFSAEFEAAQAVRNAKLSALPKRTVATFDPDSPERRALRERIERDNGTEERALSEVDA